jgi:hypothetical protein
MIGTKKSWKSVEGLTRIALKFDIAAKVLGDAAANVADLEDQILIAFMHENPPVSDFAPFRARFIKNLLDES